MTLWRLEWLRIVRTKKWLALGVTYLFFGFTSAPLVRYTQDLLERFGGGVQITGLAPTPDQAVASYVRNAGQIGLIVLVVVAASALAVDASTEWSVFLRMRVHPSSRLLVPRIIGTVALGAVAFVLGALATWYETHILLGPLSASAMIAGMLYGIVFIGFVVAVVTVATTLVRGVLGAIGISLAVILLLPVLGLILPVQRWLPTQLLGAIQSLVQGGHPADYLAATAVSTVSGAAMLLLAFHRFAAREV